MPTPEQWQARMQMLQIALQDATDVTVKRELAAEYRRVVAAYQRHCRASSDPTLPRGK